MGKGFFTFHFSSVQERDRVWSVPLPNLKPGNLRLQRWTPFFNPYNQRSTTAQVWVRFYELGPEYFYPSFLWNLARCLGAPLKIDSRSLDGSLTHFARILVEIDLSKDLETHVMVDHGNGVCIFSSISYERIPDFCKNCSVVGHSLATCRKNVVQSDLHGKNEQKRTVERRGRSKSRTRVSFLRKDQNLGIGTNNLAPQVNKDSLNQNLGANLGNLGLQVNKEGINEAVLGGPAAIKKNSNSWVDLVEEEEEEFDEEIEVEENPNPKEPGRVGTVSLPLALSNAFASLLDEEADLDARSNKIGSHDAVQEDVINLEEENIVENKQDCGLGIGEVGGNILAAQDIQDRDKRCEDGQDLQETFHDQHITDGGHQESQARSKMGVGVQDFQETTQDHQEQPGSPNLAPSHDLDGQDNYGTGFQGGKDQEMEEDAFAGRGSGQDLTRIHQDLSRTSSGSLAAGGSEKDCAQEASSVSKNNITASPTDLKGGHHHDTSLELQSSDSSYNLRPRAKRGVGRVTSGRKRRGGRRF